MHPWMGFSIHLIPTFHFFSLFIYSYLHTFLQFCWREDISNNKEDKAFLLLWGKDSYTERFLALLPCTRVNYTQMDSSLPDLFTSSQSPSHIDLCHFKVTVLSPPQWVHQTLSSFGFPICHHTSHVCSPLSMWPKSNNITAFVLVLKFAYEGDHTIFGFSEPG
jgi:hypothetical protein